MAGGEGVKRLIVLLGVLGASLSSIFVRLSTAPSLILVLYRVGMATLLLAPVVLVKDRRELKALSGREWGLCLGSGASLGLHFATYFESLRFTSIAASVVLVDTEVLFVALISILLFRKKLSKGAWLAIILALAGSVIIAMADSAGGGPDALRGDLLALCGAFFVAVYTMVGAVCRRSVSTNVYTFLVYLSASFTVLLIALLSGQAITGYDNVNYFTGFGMAVFCTLMGHSVFSWGLKYLPPAFVSTAKLMEPVFASALGLLLFREVPGMLTVIGGIIIILAVILYSRVEE
ncbi:MAG: EamA family transporter [Oscillibacter sp.]|nr:EamA family transporter [Oscillibacter sp.]